MPAVFTAEITFLPSFAAYGPKNAPSAAPPTVAAAIRAFFLAPFKPNSFASRIPNDAPATLPAIAPIIFAGDSPVVSVRFT